MRRIIASDQPARLSRAVSVGLGVERLHQADRGLIPRSAVTLLYRLVGCLAVALGVIGIVLPLVPTVPFMLLAAFCFARSSPALEARILADPRFGPHIRAWRERGSISRRGKMAALVAFGASALLGVVLMPWPLLAIPILVSLLGSTFILTRPTT
jgi:uncharacterized membrane protein YbaN (DUF454 family)